MNQEEKREKAEEYLRTHKIKELFEDLCSTVLYKQPENVEQFLIEELQTRMKMESVTLPIFTEEEVENVFHLYNLKGGKFITRQKAKEALKCIAHSN